MAFHFVSDLPASDRCSRRFFQDPSFPGDAFPQQVNEIKIQSEKPVRLKM
jgi:hypothetical protein